MEPFTLTTERLTLDVPVQTDAPRIHHYCQDPDFERYLTIPWPYRMADAEYFVSEHVPAGWASGKELIWALRSGSGELFGVVGLRIKTDRYDVGYWLGAEHRGLGFMPEAVRAVIDWAFETEYEGITEITWECVAGNAASAAVARKLGFTFVGVGPALVAARDGSHPESWHGLLRASDDRSVKPGWPLPAVPINAAPVENEGVSAP